MSEMVNYTLFFKKKRRNQRFLSCSPFRKMPNKRAAEKILSIYWFIILILTVAGIYGMINLYYNHPYDVRELEANLLINKVADCISYAGEIRPEVFNISDRKLSEEFKTNFLNNCNITFNVEEEKWERAQYYIEITFYRYPGQYLLGTISEGEKNWKVLCEAAAEGDYRKFPKCVNKRFFSLYGSDLILIDIFSAVAKNEKNVK